MIFLNLCNRLSQLRAQGKKSRKLIPRYSKAFPKDFFYEIKEKCTPKESQLGSPLTISRDRSPMRDIENIVPSLTTSKDMTSEIKNYTNYLRRSFDLTSNKKIYRRNSSSNTYLVKQIDETQKASENPSKAGIPKFQPITPVLTFRENTIKKKQESQKDSTPKSQDFEDKENIVPNQPSTLKIYFLNNRKSIYN